ncbi:MAG: hypothetical protein JW849_05460 [Phycisphaerae bacterium]|nr:hypothetical protein [Phycisphaerae bacterium]
MTDIVIEILRALVVGMIVLYFFRIHNTKEISRIKGWRMLMLGFCLLFFGTLIDITDNFPALNKYVIIGDTPVESFLEKIVGYLGGFLLVAVGVWQWFPKLIEHSELIRKQHEMEIREQRLKVLRATMVTVRGIMDGIISNINEFQKQAKNNKAVSEDCATFLNYIVQDTTERLEKLSRLDSTPEKPMAAGIGIDYEQKHL